MRRHILRIVFLSVVCLAARARGEISRGFDYVVIDGVKMPFGQVIEVSGRAQERDHFELARASACLRALRINGRANQDDLLVYLCPTDTSEKTSFNALERLKNGGSYKARGRLVFARAVGPKRALTIKVEGVEAADTTPRRFTDFLDRSATVQGTAAKGGRLETGRESARVDGLADWPTSVAGKKVAVRGTIRRDQAGWHLQGATWQLIDLVDQIGQEVSLDGVLWSSNGRWWFSYRNDKLYLTKATGPTMTFFHDDHGRRARVRGRLHRQDRPDFENIDDTHSDLVSCFVVREAKVEYLEEESNWQQKFGPIYASFHTVRAGIPELLAEGSFRKNAVGNETDAMLFAERNADVINGILRQATPQTCDVLARRMIDGGLPQAIRLLYAGMLVWLDDARGRTILTTRADPNGPPSLDALYCLGVFLSTAPAKTDIRWAEKPLIALMTSQRKLVGVKDRFGAGEELSLADAAAQFSDIPRVLLAINSAPARQAVVHYLVANSGNADVRSTIRHIYNRDIRVFGSTLPIDTKGAIDVAALNRPSRATQSLLPVDDLLRLEAVTHERYERIAILSQLLRHKHRSAVERFLEDLGDSFIYMEFRDHLSPEVIAALQAQANALADNANRNARVLILLAQKDPVPALLSLFDDPKWTDKNLALYELARFADPRAVAPVARVLREAKPTFFHVPASEPEADAARDDGPIFSPDDSRTIAVESAINAIASAKTPEAVHALIDLLSVDLARFGTSSDRKGFQRIIAGHLIELTGESFGVDAEAWRNWQRARPKGPRNQ